jgi:hypothetical protein
MIIKYILNDKGIPEECPDLNTWALWIENNNRRSTFKSYVGSYRISTVFLTFDHNMGSGPPVLWETIVFGKGKFDEYHERCAGDKDDAKVMHDRIVEMVKKG